MKKIPLSSKEYKEVIRLFGYFKGRGFSVAKDKNGYFIYTHRCRSDSYKSLRSIPVSVQRFIRSTG